MKTQKERLIEKIENAESRKQDWHRAEIVAAVRKRGKTITALSIESGLSANTLKSALHANTLKSALQFKYPKGERIISDFLGVPPQEIWPSRYPEQV